MRHRLWMLGMVATLSLAGCGNEENPAAQAEQAIEQFEESAQELREQQEQITEQLEQVRQDLNAAVQKRLALLSQELDAYERRIAGLPAQQEPAVREQYRLVQQRAQALEAALTQFVQAGGSELPAARGQLEEAYNQLRDAIETLDEQLEPVGPS